jgi:hypothetical protein
MKRINALVQERPTDSALAPLRAMRNEIVDE